MFNIPQNSGSYDNFLKLLTQRAHQDKMARQILDLLQQFYEKELVKESMVFTRAERKRLFQQVSKAILADVLKKI